MTKVNYRLEPGRFDENTERAARLTPQLLTGLVEEIMHTAHRNVVKRTPVGWSGQLRAAYQVEMRGRFTRRIQGALTNPTKYHEPAEEGRNPGKQPPIDALVPWVGSKLGIPPGPERRSVAFLVARKIGQSGTSGAHMVRDGWAETRTEIRPRLKQVGVRIVRTIR